MELIKSILIGKVFTFGFNQQFVIVGVRKNSLHGYLEVLAGKLYEYSCKEYCSGEIQIYSWYCYNPKHTMFFVNRSNKQAIRNCLKKRPEKIKYHIGKCIDISKYKITDNQYTKYYAEYLNK